MELVYVGVGSNVGDRNANLEKARELLSQDSRIRFERISPVYETEPVGMSGDQFLNAVFEIRTSVKPQAFIEILKSVEQAMGRADKGKNLPRNIDLDLLFFGSLMLEEPGLVIPHPRLHERFFVLKPMSDLAPFYYHPKLGKTVLEMLSDVENAV
jgi:2-amino-4-hydroxy-6-hydroxymethyldihydropteridine diphosphokinase